jgi:hypothetical protein
MNGIDGIGAAVWPVVALTAVRCENGTVAFVPRACHERSGMILDCRLYR